MNATDAPNRLLPQTGSRLKRAGLGLGDGQPRVEREDEAIARRSAAVGSPVNRAIARLQQVARAQSGGAVDSELSLIGARRSQAEQHATAQSRAPEPAGARYDATGAVADRFFAPSAGVAAGKGILRGRGSVYRGFRAPKLNELYRPFRVGDVQTLANPLLRPETLFGAEAGFDLSGRARRLSLTLFRNSLNHLITNATLSTGPHLILRQKENAGPALSRGGEANLQQRWRNWLGWLGYLYADSRFQTGLTIPEVPRHQFDDDLNQFVLPGYAVVQFSARREICRHLTAIVAIENLSDRQCVVARSPAPNIGAPRLWRAGLRWAL